MAMGEEEVEIVKPRTDKREYRRIVLRNSLEVLLISDPDTDKAAAAMNVGVGSVNDPEGLQGLAQLLMHTLFYASEKYPLEDSFSKFVSEHGGSTLRRYIDLRNSYHAFDVNSDCFEEALDRFAQFFIKALMSADAIMREKRVIDSGYQDRLLSDSNRMHQLHKHLSVEGHPYGKPNTGNWDTLEVQPKKRGLDTGHELIKFYEENYSANLMHLVIYAKDSLDKIQSLVEHNFQEIRNTSQSCSLFPGLPCTSEHLQILAQVVPIKQGHKLTITWPITPSIHHYKEGPCRYLKHLIGHKGEGSLFYVLKKLGWATSLFAGEGDWSYDFSFFNIGIDLTDAGHECMQDIVGLVFKYIQLLQQTGVQEWIFDELSAICETEFHYWDKISPSDFVAYVAPKMQFYPPKDWLVQSSLPSKFSPGIIQMVLDELTSNNVRIFWESKNFEGHTDMVEPWFGTAYSVKKITVSVIQQWVLSAPNEHLHLPARNIFIPTDFSLKEVQDKAKFPILLRRSSYSTLWYKPDTNFCTPKAYIKIVFNCPYSRNSPAATVLTYIFTQLLTDYLNEYACDAQIAGLYYQIDHTDSGFEEMVTKTFQNFKFQQPHEQAEYYCSLILLDHTWPWMEKLEVLPHLESDDLAKFSPLMLSRAFLHCYMTGNIEPGEAESMIQHIEDVFFKGPHPKCQPPFPFQQMTNRVVELDRGMTYLYPMEGLNPADDNSALVHYIQVHQDDFMLNVKLQLFALIAKQAAFHQLRSVDQLGFISELFWRNDFGIHGVQFTIQSAVKGPGYIDSRVEAFLKNVESKLYEMTNDVFKNKVNALIDKKLAKHQNLWEESEFYWKEISNGTLKFDRRESEVEALRQLTQQEFIDFFTEYIKVGAPQKKILSVRVYGRLHSSEYTVDKSKAGQPHTVIIDDIFSFRRSRPLYVSFKGGFGHMQL
ncbi:hypothetical protein L1049_008919 [Liquidambar formosana]|uniref:Insulin-degrading enzyme-like 1, peroxisomal n=1 Tax=Liquidambar formosana TaxID=63359 RepID=A0AAP0S733_LIQFO